LIRYLVCGVESLLNIDRIWSLRGLFETKDLDGYIVAKETDMLYFTGFASGSRLLIPREGENLLFVYGVNYEAAKATVKDSRIELVRMDEDVDKKLAEQINRLKLRRVGFDALEASTYLKLREALKGEMGLKALEELVWSLRKIKDGSEITLIQKAAEITSRGISRAFEILREGLKEREVAREIEYEMRRLGSDGVAFDTIVASGPNSVFPHGSCGDRKIMKGDLVVIDIGAKYHGYCADLTRTITVGISSPRQAEIYEVVRSAQEMAIKNMKARSMAKEVDAVARNYIAKKGYSEYFVHTLGHGIGLDVHEPPSLSPTSNVVLANRNVLTVEPGIYVPSFGGIRIEDTMLIREDGAEKITDAPYIFTLRD